MPRDGSGNYTLPHDASAMAANTLADVSEVNENYADIATALTGSLPRDGSAAMLAPLLAVAGSVSAPGITFSGDTDTGLYRSASDTLAAAANGALIFTVSEATGLNLADNLLTRPYVTDAAEKVNALGSDGGTRTVDYTQGHVVTATVSTSTNTFAFTNPPASGRAGSFTLILTNGGSQTVNWPASVDWAGGTAPTLTTSGVDILTFVTVDGGTTWYGFAAGLDMS